MKLTKMTLVEEFKILKKIDNYTCQFSLFDSYMDIS